MKIFDYYKKSGEPVILLLGRFDGLHKGHLKIIESALKYKTEAKLNASVCMFNFIKSGAISRLNGIFDFEETVFKAKKYGVEAILTAPLSDDLYSITATEFLKTLFNNFKIQAVFCGVDYTFGKGKEGNVSVLKNYVEKLGVTCTVVDTVTCNGEKISTTKIKELLSTGDINTANYLLGDKYFIKGKISKGRGVGIKLGYPTANLNLSQDKFIIMQGVYITQTLIDGKLYKSITNYGGAPTFGVDNLTVETYIIGEFDNLYDKDIIIYFLKYLRPVRAFSDVDELKKQIEKDITCL